VKKTPLYDFHIRCGARMVDFAGWEMPILYTGIIEEHIHTRQNASLFDVSHMGRIELRGNDAESLLQRVCTRQLASASVGQSCYSHVCNKNGGILDDVIVSRYEDHWLMVCNASNRDKIVAWLHQQATERDVNINDITESTMMVAIQGPATMAFLAGKLPIDISDLKRYHFKSGSYWGMSYGIFRTGYTGEDGIEMILPASVASLLMPMLTGESAQSSGIKPAGLGARDTLRLEAGMPLYGHELHEKIDTISAGLGWCVDLDKEFIGAGVIRKVNQNGPQQRLAGLVLEGRRIARQNAVVLDEDNEVGLVTSGTFSPTLSKSIAMAYIQTPLTEPGQQLTVDLGGKRTKAMIVPLPFYKREKT